MLTKIWWWLNYSRWTIISLVTANIQRQCTQQFGHCLHGHFRIIILHSNLERLAMHHDPCADAVLHVLDPTSCCNLSPIQVAVTLYHAFLHGSCNKIRLIQISAAPACQKVASPYMIWLVAALPLPKLWSHRRVTGESGDAATPTASRNWLRICLDRRVGPLLELQTMIVILDMV